MIFYWFHCDICTVELVSNENPPSDWNCRYCRAHVFFQIQKETTQLSYYSCLLDFGYFPCFSNLDLKRSLFSIVKKNFGGVWGLIHHYGAGIRVNQAKCGYIAPCRVKCIRISNNFLNKTFLWLNALVDTKKMIMFIIYSCTVVFSKRTFKLILWSQEWMSIELKSKVRLVNAHFVKRLLITARQRLVFWLKTTLALRVWGMWNYQYTWSIIVYPERQSFDLPWFGKTLSISTLLPWEKHTVSNMFYNIPAHCPISHIPFKGRDLI